MIRIYRLLGTIIVLTLFAGCGSNTTAGAIVPLTTMSDLSSVAATKSSSTAANIPTSTLRTRPVTLRVGSPIYFIGNTISITLSNHSNRTIYFPDHLTNCTIVLLQRQMNGNWLTANLCRLEIATRIHSLGARQRLIVRLVAPLNGWLPGLYRATLSYRASLNAGRPTTIFSAVFKVVLVVRPVP
jgi:hypothetical protein